MGKKTCPPQKGIVWSSDCASRAADLVTHEVPALPHLPTASLSSPCVLQHAFAWHRCPWRSADFSPDCWSTQQRNTSGVHGTDDTRSAPSAGSFLRWAVKLQSERGPSPFPERDLRATAASQHPGALARDHRALCSLLAQASLWLRERDSHFTALGQWRGGVPISYSSYEKPPGNLLPKRITELRCGLASPLLTHTVAMVWSRSCACSIPWQGREGQTRYITRPFPQLDRLNVSSVWSNGKERKKKKKKAHLQHWLQTLLRLWEHTSDPELYWLQTAAYAEIIPATTEQLEWFMLFHLINQQTKAAKVCLSRLKAMCLIQ